MLKIVHWIIVAMYLALPAGALTFSIWRWARTKKRAEVSGLVMTAIAGLALSTAMSLIYAAAAGGRVVLTQVGIGAYFAVGMLLLLKAFDAGVRWSLRWLFRLGPGRSPGAEGKAESSRWILVRSVLASVLRVGIVATVALPYVMSSVMTYRPKVHPRETPRTQLGFDYQRMTFAASDGVELVGWWIPAARAPASVRGSLRQQWGKNTVLVCHGLAANKSNQLVMARQLVPGGFNVLAFDFRAHGESGGQLTTFGKLEVNDVLGAVRWVRENHADQAHKIFGVGASMGGSALIVAAADDSDQGRAIEAVATYAAYDSLDGLAQSVTRNYFVKPLGWLLMHVGLPLASAQTGADLTDFSPADRAADLWPRPLLLIHGGRDPIIPIHHGWALYNRAVQPKYQLFLDNGEHNDVLNHEGAAQVVLRFFRSAQAVPAI